MNVSIIGTLVGASLFISANAAAAVVLDRYPQNIASSPAAGGRVILAEHDMPMSKGGMGQSGGGTGMGHGGMDKMQPSGMPPTAAPQIGNSPHTSPVAPQCPPGTSLQMDSNGQHLCK